MTGAQMATVAIVSAYAFAVSRGDAKVYVTTGDSGGKVHRSFCAHCGSRLYCTSEATPGVYIVEAGSLDDASELKPAAHFYTSSAQRWAHIPSDIPRYAKLPPATQ